MLTNSVILPGTPKKQGPNVGQAAFVTCGSSSAGWRNRLRSRPLPKGVHKRCSHTSEGSWEVSTASLVSLSEQQSVDCSKLNSC